MIDGRWCIMVGLVSIDQLLEYGSSNVKARSVMIHDRSGRAGDGHLAC